MVVFRILCGAMVVVHDLAMVVGHVLAMVVG